jgi:hypothetical protein
MGFMTLFRLPQKITFCLLLGLMACQGSGSLTREPVQTELPLLDTVVSTLNTTTEIVELPSFFEAISDVTLANFTSDFGPDDDLDWDKSLELMESKGQVKLVSQLLRMAKTRLATVTDFSKKAILVLNQAGFNPKTAEPVSALLSQSHLFDLAGDWFIHGKKEQGSEAGLRFFYDYDEQTVATFLASAIRDGVAQKGILAFVNPQLLEKTTDVGQRAFIVAYDVSHPDRTLFVVREEKAMLEHPSILTELHAQCDTVVSECLAEVIRADGAPGSLAVTGSLRMSWNQTTQNICLQESKPGETTFESAKDLAGRDCEMIEAAWWGSQPLSDEDLVLGYFDTEPPGGDAALILLDGQTRDGWLSLSENLIDGWLSGMSL